MVRTNFSGRDIASVLHDFGYERVGRVGSHLKMRYESLDTEEVRIVTVPMASEDEIPPGRCSRSPTSAEPKTSTRGVSGSTSIGDLPTCRTSRQNTPRNRHDHGGDPPGSAALTAGLFCKFVCG